MYRKSDLARDSWGFVRNLGRTEDGKQVRFRLGSDEQQATLAAAKLVVMWQRLQEEGKTAWDNSTLLLARGIARGQTSIGLALPSADPEILAAVLTDLSNRFGDLIQIKTSDLDKFRQGQQANDDFRERTTKQLTDTLPPAIPVSLAPIVSGSLHGALDDFRHYLETKADPSGHFRLCGVAVARLKERHDDFPLSEMTEERMFVMLELWAKRPAVKGTDRPITRTTAQYHIKRLREFWRWLHRSEKYTWKKPDGWEDLKVKIANRPEDRERKHRSLTIDTFNLDELSQLFHSAVPLVRSFMLLALNCGFKHAEIATLTRSELYLDKSHPDARLLVLL